MKERKEEKLNWPIESSQLSILYERENSESKFDGCKFTKRGDLRTSTSNRRQRPDESGMHTSLLPLSSSREQE
jgi:hypothetical protein